MKSGGGLVIGLSLVFGFLLLAAAAELYYLLWWKKRIRHRHSEEEEEAEEEKGKEYYATGKYAKEFFQFHLVCWKKNPTSSDPEPDPEQGGAGGGGATEESAELELMRLHNLRLLFTIKEETKEDLESEDGRSMSRSKSLSEILMTAAPPFMDSPRYSMQGFNPLFESAAEAELNRIRSSPPPKFKFMRDAEDKLLRRLMEEANNGGSVMSPAAEAREGSFLGFLKNRESAGIHHLPLSSQVTPLNSEN
ncbi:hypothetical protein LINPERHAP2_LOCUS27086 [Linum perenne]